MTVTYTAEVATCLKFGSFIKLLARWRGSIYKLIWVDLFLFLVLYYVIHVIYYYLISGNGYKETFESIVVYCSSYLSFIPLSFVLGFYVNLVMTRWWDQYITIPWPDSVAVFVSACVHGQDEGGRLMRRTIMRYVCLCLTIVFTMISPGVKKRFPKMKHLVEAGLLLENERQIFEKLDTAFPKYPKHWMPIIWAASIITRARKEGRIRDDFAVKTIIDELNDFRGRCGTLLYYDFISIPLVYTQVVTIAVYSYFLCSLLAHQWTEKKNNTYEQLNFYYPIFISLQFFFYMGWLKVAETLINPFGEDDDDFEVNWMIDRNLQISYLIVDEMHHEHPELLRDQYWDEVYPSELPYVSEAKKEKHPESSTAKYDLLDMPQGIETRPSSKTNLLIMNGKLGSTISTSRSQRFNEAFQRFFNYSQAGLRSDAEISLQSDIENIEQITSYIYSDPAEFETKIENESIGEPPTLEPITEESEAFFEKVEEDDVMNDEEEDDKIETQSSHESDSDSDPFERLRIERQKQRLQRMNDFMERYFGSSFQTLTQIQNITESRFKSKAQEYISSKNSVHNNNLTKKVSNEFEVKLDLVQIADDENLLTPNVSTARTTQKADISDQKQITFARNPVEIEKNPEDEENNEYSNFQLSSTPEENGMETKSNTEYQEDIKQNVSVVTIKAICIEQSATTAAKEVGSPMQDSQVPFDGEVPNVLIPEAELIGRQENILPNLSHTTAPEKEPTPLASKLSDLNSIQLTRVEENDITAKELVRTFESKATSPLGSPVSSSIPSCSSDWQIPTSDVQSADKRRIEQEESEE